MTQRDRILAIFLGTALVVGLGYIMYTMAVRPFLDERARVKKLREETLQLTNENLEMSARLKRMSDLNKRSLPGNIDFARQEYESALNRLLKESKITSGFTLREMSPEPAPELEKGVPAYRKLAFQITINKAEIGMLMTFMEKYYQLNLLHHISSLSIRRTETAGNKKTDSPDARRDLEVNIKTEAILLDSADRRTLFYIPDSFGTIGGGAGLLALRTAPKAARGIRPPEIDRILALPYREDYAMVTYRDPFHGPYPEPKPPEPKKEVVIPEPPKKPDVSAFIKFTSLIEQSTGNAQLFIRDTANNIDYDILLTQTGEKLLIEVEKSTVDPQLGRRIKDRDHPKTGMLVLSDSTSSTKRTFKIHGLLGDSLVLSEKSAAVSSQSPTPKGGGKPVFGKAPPGRVVLPPPDPKAALIGGMFAAGPKPDNVFTWDVGQPLTLLKQLKLLEGKKAIQEAEYGLYGPPVPKTIEAIREIAPAPRAFVEVN